MRKIIVFILVLSLCFLVGCKTFVGGKEGMITTDEVLKVINENKNNENFVLLDVRTEEEYEEFHIEGSVNKPIMDENEFIKSVKDIDKEKDIIVYCRTQNRSVMAYAFMAENGYKNVKYMVGGITYWVDEGKPVVKG